MTDSTPATAAIRPLSRCLDCDAAVMSGAAEKPCPVSGGAHRWDHGRPATAATDECVPPCPVADGAMGLLCTCGNVVKRWQATSAMLRGETTDGE